MCTLPAGQEPGVSSVRLGGKGVSIDLDLSSVHPDQFRAIELQLNGDADDGSH